MLHKVQRSQWQPFFDRVAAALGAKTIDVDIIGPGIGSQAQARRVVLTGLSYDAKDDVFAVIAEELEHNIAHPRAINVDEELEALRSLEVVDSAGNHHIVTLSDPLRLPPAASQGAV
jgi:hypothetical protein